MKRLTAFALAAASLIAAVSPVFGQSPSYPVGGIPFQRAPGTVAMCINAAGQAVPPALCDQAPDVTAPYRYAAPEQRGYVVSLSPNSGAANPYPAGAQALTETATGTTGGATATFPALAGKTNFLCGFSFSPGSATTAITITVTTTGLTNNFSLSAGAPVTAVGVTGTSVVHPISPCVPASAINTAITVVAGALGTAGVGQAVNAWGYRQ